VAGVKTAVFSLLAPAFSATAAAGSAPRTCRAPRGPR